MVLPRAYPGTDGTLSQERADAIDSIINLPNGAIPKGLDGKLVKSGQNVNPTTEEHTFDKSTIFPQSSVDLGLTRMSEAGGFVVISNPLSPTVNFALTDSRFDDTGSFPPRYFNLEGIRIENVQTTDTTVITTNPLPFSLTTSLLAQTNKLIFKANGPMINVSMKIVDNAFNEPIKYVPSKVAFEDGIGGVSLIAGINIIDFISKDPDTPGLINIGLTPFRLFPSTQLDITIKADNIDLLGDATEFPFLDAEVQDAKLTDVAIVAQSGLSNLFIPAVNSDGELLDSSIKDLGDKIEITVNDATHLPNLVGTTPQTLNRADVYLETTTTDTITNKQFTASPTNPLIEIDNTGIFSAGEFIRVKGTKFNNGVYEVAAQLGFVIFIESVISKVEDWTKGNVVTALETGTVTKVHVSVRRTSLEGKIQHGEGSVAPLTYFTLAHADDVPLVKKEKFANTDSRFFAELGLPAAQGWTDIELGGGAITQINDTVFGVKTDVNRYVITGDGQTAKSKLAMPPEQWNSNLTDGFSFRCFGCRITEDINTQSIFSGTGFSAVNDPRPSSIRSRVGIFISEDGINTTIRLDGQATIVLDGTSGKPLVLIDTYFNWEVFVDETPDAGVNFGAATLFVNDIQIIVGSIVASNDAVDDEVSFANSSSSGSTTFYAVNFGVTTYEEGNVKTLSTDTMLGDIRQIFRPGGKRDHTVIIPDGSPSKEGDRLDFIGGSPNTKLLLRTENLSVPKSLFDDVHELEINIVSNEPISFTNTLTGGNVYIRKSQILNQQPLGFEPGSINYDPEKGTMNVRNKFPGSSIQVGQEEVRFVVNKTGVTVNEGEVVHVEGYDLATDALTIGLSIANLTDESRVTGLATTTMINNAIGLVTISGRVNDLDTSSFSEGDVVFLSDTNAGEFTNVAPVVEVQLGIIGKVDVSEGFIDLNIKTTVFRSAIATASSILDQFANDTSDTFIDFEIRDLTNVTWDNAGKFFKNTGATTSKCSFEPQIGRRSTGTSVVVELWGEVSDDDGVTFTVESLAIFKQTTNSNSSVSPITTNLKPGNCIRYGMILSGNIASSGIISNGQGSTNPGVSISGRTVPSVALTII